MVKPPSTAHCPKPFVHILIVNWCGWRDTLACLASLAKSDYPRFKVVVIDNGSNDDSVTRIHNAYPRATLVQAQYNLGFAGGNNLGIRRALEHGADYVWLLNNDTAVDPKALSSMVDTAAADPEIGAVGSILYHMADPTRVQVWGGGGVNLWLGISRHHTAPVPPCRLHYLTGASLLLRRSALERVGLLDEGFFMYWEDTDYAFRLRKAGYRLAVAPGARVWHAGSASTGKDTPTLDAYFNASAVRFFRRHAPIPAAPIAISLGGKLLKRAVRCDWARIRAIWRGFHDARRTRVRCESRKAP